MKRGLPLILALGLLGPSGPAARAQKIEGSGRERPAVDKGVTFLRQSVSQFKDAGEAAIAALAMIKAAPVNDPPNDAQFRNAVARFAVTFRADGTFMPETRGGPDNYEAAVILLALVNLDAIQYKPQIDLVAQFLMGRQMANGSWDYTNRTLGDESMSQYALLALWEAENAGIVVRPEVWDRAARYYLSVQAAGGSWTYHRDSPNQGETISMTAAGIGSLLLCQRQLARHRRGQEGINPLMIPVNPDGTPLISMYKVETPAGQIKAGIDKGLNWMTRNFQVNTSDTMGQSTYYGLYGVERMAALDDTKTMEALRWYDKGLEYALAQQQGNGSWDSKQHGVLANTCWAILFSTQSTKKSMVKIKLRKLGAGAQRGGSALPTDLTNVEIINGQVVAKPMGGAIDGMLKVLDDPESEKWDSALNGLIKRYQEEGPKVLRPLKASFRKLMTDRDASKRQIGAWALGRIGDLDSAPVLMKGLFDVDDDVMGEARDGLRVLSRKLEGFGPPDKATPEQRLEAAKKWLAWYNNVKPPDLDAPDDILPSWARQAAAASPAK